MAITECLVVRRLDQTIMKVVVYISDIGSGHLSRVNAILKSLVKKVTVFEVHIRHGKNGKRVQSELSYLYSNCEVVSFVQVESLIDWFPAENGSPELKAIRENIDFEYIPRSEAFILRESQLLGTADVILSDYVAEAFSIAINLNCPAFGFMHFTWGWFFSKCYPTPLSEGSLSYLASLEALCSNHFVMPLTPSELVNSIACKFDIGFICAREKLEEIRSPEEVKKSLVFWSEISNFKSDQSITARVLIVDSGAGLSSQRIHQLTDQLSFSNPDIDFIVCGKLEGQSFSHNVSVVKGLNSIEFYRLLVTSDLVVGRAGFNLIVESMYLRKKILFFNEPGNPEMVDNIYQCAKQGIGKCITPKLVSTPELLKEYIFRSSEGFDINTYPFDGDESAIVEILKRIHP